MNLHSYAAAWERVN